MFAIMKGVERIKIAEAPKGGHCSIMLCVRCVGRNATPVAAMIQGGCHSR